jgi:hypothetical protein
LWLQWRRHALPHLKLVPRRGPRCARRHRAAAKVVAWPSGSAARQYKNEETFRLKVEAGHAGMHRNYVPTKEELDVLLNITESLIETVYVNPHQAKTLKEISPRKGK